MALTFHIYHISIGSVAFTAFVLQVIGLGLLIRFKRGTSNQVPIFLSLATTETLYCFNGFTCSVLRGMEVKKRNLIFCKLGISFFALMANRLIMIYLVVDRFLEVFLHMRYPTVFNKKRARYTLASIWIISAIYGVAAGIYRLRVNGINAMYTIHNYASFVLDIIFVLTAVSVYVYFYIKVRNFQQNCLVVGPHLANESTSNRFSVRNAKFIIPFLIVVSYLLFNVSATILFKVWSYGDRVHTRKKRSYMLLVIRIMYNLGFICDSILYIFLQKKIRAAIITCICRRCKASQNLGSKGGGQITFINNAYVYDGSVNSSQSNG